MTREELKSLYAKRQSDFATTVSKLDQRINLISNVRLVVAGAFIAILYFGFANYSLLYLLPIVVLIFVVLVRNHSRLFNERAHVKNLVNINKAEQESLSGNYKSFDAGSKFLDTRHPYSYDLDIFGDGSLFQIINRCNTIIGKQKLASHLTSILNSKDDIIRKQEGIKELSDRVDFRQHYQAAGMEIEELEADRSQLLSWSAIPAFVHGKKSYRLLLLVVPAITLLAVIASFFNVSFRPLAILFAAFQWAFLGFHIKSVNYFHEFISKKKNTLEKYARLLHYLKKEQFNSPQLKSFWLQAADADVKVKQLASLVRALDARMNSMTTLVMNSLFMYDLQCVYRLEKWKEENASKLGQWLDTAAEMEVLNSFATFAFNNKTFLYPAITDDFAIRAKQMGHPLIDPSECIVNDFSIGNGPTILIVTGANMAGKSTFLRTLGINTVLALNGVPVFASEFSCPIIHLRTGMRTADSLKDHQSYFYAELDRLKSIMDELRRGQPLLILLDEILKGTNSTDKQSGSISLVKQLMPHSCLALIATHDVVLGELENQFPDKVKNYHFEANIENDQLSFDYKLKPGIAEKMNATFLMKKMGIIPS
jgi:DNA mismatch repair ATPase MutS